MVVASCFNNTLLLCIIVILCIAFTNDIFQSMPILRKLFTDTINYYLLIMLVILVILIDMPSGLILLFLVLYLSVYVNRSNRKSSFTDIASNTNYINTKDTKYPKYNLTTSNSQTRSESEFLYNNTKPFPNNNLQQFQPIQEKSLETHPSQPSQVSQSPLVLQASQEPDFITRVDKPNRDGYDITGCRYDFKNSPQNLTINGPPLAQCATYSGTQAKLCGTVFYPLNA